MCVCACVCVLVHVCVCVCAHGVHTVHDCKWCACACVCVTSACVHVHYEETIAESHSRVENSIGGSANLIS